MAGPRTSCSPRSNSLPTGKEKLIGGALEAPIEGSNISTATLATSPAPAPTSGPPGLYTDVNLQRATKVALKLFVKGQEHSQANFAFRNRAFKA